MLYNFIRNINRYIFYEIHLSKTGTIQEVQDTLFLGLNYNFGPRYITTNKKMSPIFQNTLENRILLQ